MLVFNRIRYWLRKFEYKNRINKIASTKGRRTLVFQTPLHKNLGDHLIAEAVMQFLKDIGIDNIFEIPNELFLSNKQRLTKVINDNDVIVITGGGFIGNVWSGEEIVLESILETFPENKVIIFPQTVWFEKSNPMYEQEIKSCKNALESHKNLTLFVRESNSYKFIKNNFPNVNVELVPDIALYYKMPCINVVDERLNVGFCLRNDVEKVRDENIIISIKNILKTYNVSITDTDTMSNSRVWEHERGRFVVEKIKEFSRYKLLVTDRLHGMIFAYLAGTPCIVLDNKSKKVTGVYNEWFNKCGTIMPVLNSFDEALMGEFIYKAMLYEFDVSNAEFDKNSFKRLKEKCLCNEK